MLAVLRQRNFGLLWMAGLISMIGDWAFYAAMPVFILDRTGSVFLSGLVWTFIALPQVVLSPIAGVYVDRLNRRHIMIASNIAQAGAMAVLLIVGSSVGVALALGLILVESILATIYSPAENALLPTVVGDDDLPTANALNALNDSIARVAGPFLGAALYAWIDIRGTALANLLSFALAAALVGLVAIPPKSTPHHDARTESVWKSMQEGAGRVRRSQLLRTVFILQIMVSFADGPLSAMLTAFVRETLNRSASDVGIFFSMRGVAGIVGGVVIAHSIGRFRVERLLIVCLFVLSIEIVLLAYLRNFWIIIAMMILVGPVFAALSTVFPTLLQRGTQDAWRGRVFALYAALAGGTFALSTFLGAVLGSITSPPVTMVVSGFLYFLAAIFALLRLPAAVDSHSESADQSPVFAD